MTPTCDRCGQFMSSGGRYCGPSCRDPDEPPTCQGPDCDEKLTGRWKNTYCSIACSNRARAGEDRDGYVQLSTRPAHGHRVTVESVASDGERWQVVYGCRDCPATWRGPISFEDFEDVACEQKAGQGRAA